LLFSHKQCILAGLLEACRTKQHYTKIAIHAEKHRKGLETLLSQSS